MEPVPLETPPEMPLETPMETPLETPRAVRPVVHPDPVALGRAVAARVRSALDRTAAQGRPCLLGVPAGRTLRPVLAALAADLRARPLDLDHLVVVMMDEYLVGGQRVDPAAEHSCSRFGRVEVLDALGVAREGALWSPDPRDPAAYEERLAAAGGVELFLVALGAGDGHVALNPPGTPLDSRTRVLDIAESTRRDNLATFPSLRSLGEVPERGVSVGLGTIAGSREVLALAHGTGKAGVVARVLAADRHEPGLPATFLHALDPAATALHVDAAAARLLP